MVQELLHLLGLCSKSGRCEVAYLSVIVPNRDHSTEIAARLNQRLAGLLDETLPILLWTMSWLTLRMARSTTLTFSTRSSVFRSVSMRRCASTIRPTSVSSSSMVSGLARYAVAPSFSADIAVSVEAYPVTTINAMSG